MKAGKKSLPDSEEMNPTEALQRFVGVFESKGWLNRTLRIKHCDKRYRICCSEREFFVYRINDHGAVMPGVACWPVCMVSNEEITEDSDMSAFASGEPSAQDWLRCIMNGDFEFI